MVCALGREDGTIIEQVSIPTTTPEETIPKITAYFKDKGIEALGIGAFGPVGVDPKADNYGYILETPKLAWRNKDLLGGLKKELNVPMGIDTDVNGSCLGEVTYGCAKGLDSVVYITIGTGVGVGVWVNGGLLHGMLHPEGGHIPLTVIRKMKKAASARTIKTALRALQAAHQLKHDGARKPLN